MDALHGLHAAHELRDESGKSLRIIHRDISPHNVLLGCDGRAHLTDFGIAKAEDRVQTTRTHEVKGKLAYLAPERIDKRRMCTVQSDVFSMAVVLWECFAGRRLFRGEDAVDILQEVMSAPIPTLRQIGAQIPPALDDVVARALSRDLETRYTTALDLAQALERAAGPEGVGTHADVARLMEAIFGGRMAQRQEHVRATIGPGETTLLLRESGLPDRDPVTIADIPTGQLLAELAPPAPTGRYALGTDFQAHVARLQTRSGIPWWGVGAAGGGIVVGALLTLAVVARRTHPAPVVVRGSPATLQSAEPAPAPSARRVLVALPFQATQVQFDDTTRDLDPATDVVAIDVRAGAGPRHRISAIAVDGTRAEGLVREQDGLTQPESPGFTFFLPDAPPGSEPRAGGARPARPVGTVHNGFTKLR